MRIRNILLSGACLGLLSGQLQASIIQGFEGGSIAPGVAGGTYSSLGPCGAGTELFPEASYAVTSSATACHNLWLPVTAQEGSLFLAVNGNTSTGLVYEQTEGGLTIGNTYSLFAWFSGLYTTNPADITWNITAGGTTPVNSFLTNTTGAWEQNGITFVATATSVTFNISINTFQASGNDFGVDNINLEDLGNLNEVPEPGSFALFGTGAAFLIGLARRRAARKN
ncbi:MAG: PEP-CTERM sorting domain-containing protein [Acidobacteriota bacterium]